MLLLFKNFNLFVKCLKNDKCNKNCAIKHLTPFYIINLHIWIKTWNLYGYDALLNKSCSLFGVAL